MTQFKEKAGKDRENASIGLYDYPVLMAADILLFNAHKVPVGRDQVQHIEMARDFGQRFNHVYGREYFVLPEAAVDDNVATLPGLDGRKMSKSYGNTIPLFARPAELKKLIFSILTDSRAPGEAKDTEGSPLFQLYQAFATPEQTQGFAQAYADGIGWGDAKQQLLDLVETQIAPLRERYDALIARPDEIEDVLRDGAARLRSKYATPFIAELRQAVGLRNLAQQRVVAKASVGKAALPQFKQYREKDGRFYFKLLDSDGSLLIQSQGLDTPKLAGELVAVLKQAEQGDALESTEFTLEVEVPRVLDALARLREATA
jgi:tryptophanyl-tRNA synthetase